MGVFVRSLRALMWRNFLYRKRRPFSSLVEFILPIMTVYILVRIKNSAQDSFFLNPITVPATYPSNDDVIIPLSFTDYVTALQANRRCIGGGRRYPIITGLSSNWAVPFVHCDPSRCSSVNNNATLACDFRVLAIAPDNDVTRSFANWILETNPALANRSQLPFDYDFIQVFQSSDDIDIYVTADEYGSTGHPNVGGAIVIEEGKPSYSYSIRVNSTNFNLPMNLGRPAALTHPTTKLKLATGAKTSTEACADLGGGPRQGKYDNTCTGKYMYNGAITLQRLVDDWIIHDSGAESKGNKVAENGVSFVTFPTKEYEIDGFYKMISNFVPLLIVLGLLYPVSNMIRMIADEKEKRQKELLKMMSVPDYAIEWSWFLSYFVFFSPCSLLVAYTCSQLFDKSDLSLLVVFWVLIFIATICYCMAISAYFSKATRAGLFGLMSFFGGYFSSVNAQITTESLPNIIMSSLHPVSAISFGLQMIGTIENAGLGMTWETYHYSENISGYSFATTLKVLLFSIFWWSMVTWYLNRVKSGTYGRAYPLYFPFTKSYWLGGSRVLYDDDEDEENEAMLDGETNSVKIEPVSDTLKQQEMDGKSVEIRNLTKQFGEKTAVDSFSLSMYSGQVTALLGHNGAGKTTTINMLTGMVKPSSGYALVAGKDIRTQMPEIREGVGVCLQHDCLFPLLTVKEHIQFFAQIKGLYSGKSRDEAEESIDTSIRDVALSEKSNTYAKNLSGGMKRKLSLAIAFCGDSKVVFLDEPTSGMDPFSRRFTWNVIRQYRPNRCIILTTHFMDEADLLGDRIAIMAEGRLRCVGSSLYLKKAYGVGYQLTIEKNSYTQTSTEKEVIESNSVNVSTETNIKMIIENAVEEANELSNVGTEMSFQLPLNSSSQFIQIFSELDKLVSENKIVSYGVSITTLDEVFLMVARGESRKSLNENQIEDMSAIDEIEPSSEISPDEVDLEATKYDVKKHGTGKIYYADIDKQEKVFSRHLKALFVKRAKNFKRDKKAWCCSVLCPSILSLIGFLFMTYAVETINLEPLELTIDDYNPDIVKQDERHPISFNTAGEFACNPGSCLQSDSFTEDDEMYYMCGSSTSISSDAVCSVSNPVDILGKIKQNGVILIDDDTSTNVGMLAHQLDKNSNGLEASQYGALFYKHDASSTILSGANDLNGLPYNNTAISQCKNSGDKYRTAEQCNYFGGISYIVSTNFTSIHAPLIFQAIADEALINEVVEDDISIAAKVHPLPITSLEQTYFESGNAFAAWFILIFSFPFITGSFATFIVAERQNKSKHLQTVSGVTPSVYWLSSYMWDIMNYQIPLWIVVGMMYGFDVESFTTPEKDIASGTIITLALFGPASAAFTYCVTFLFNSPSKCNAAVICFNFMIGLAGPLVVYILDLLSFVPDLKYFEDISFRVAMCLRLFPAYNLGKALLYIINVEQIGFTAGRPLTSVWDPMVLQYEVIFLAIEGVIYLILAICLDRWLNLIQKSLQFIVGIILLKPLRNRMKRSDGEESDQVVEPMDEDVDAENGRVLSGGADGDLIVLKQITKIYGNDKLAVDNLSLGIPAGECFGLLGINGAGKTTTMAMLTAEFSPTSGDAWLDGFSVSAAPEETRRRIGYCPQFDAHFLKMTGREHVELYAAIKGIPREHVKNAATAKLEEVGLNKEDSNKLSSKYSGGMKRKLSVACATIGQPPIVFLDEPSTGMDPCARRELWKMISSMVKSVDHTGEARTSVILTTHSMEECEALCPRIGIMAGGKMKCLGSAQHLKSRFGKGYQVELKVATIDSVDEDYLSTVRKLLTIIVSVDVMEEEEAALIRLAQGTMIKLLPALAAVQSLTNDTSIASMIKEGDPNGYVIYKNAISESGVTINELAAFCAGELRMKAVMDFMLGTYPNAFLKERQDTKARFQIDSDDLKISNVFYTIEGAKAKLRLADYGVSQTTLEQVFNMHAAAEAETQENKANEDQNVRVKICGCINVRMPSPSNRMGRRRRRQ